MRSQTAVRNSFTPDLIHTNESMHLKTKDHLKEQRAHFMRRPFENNAYAYTLKNNGSSFGIDGSMKNQKWFFHDITLKLPMKPLFLIVHMHKNCSESTQYLISRCKRHQETKCGHNI